MTIREKQHRFAQLVPGLLEAAFRLGYQVTLGEAWRSPEEAARLAALGLGIKASLHTQRLALDLNLFRDGRYLTQAADYQPLGEWWEQQSDPDRECAWGGRFRRIDAAHFSLAHGGRK